MEQTPFEEQLRICKQFDSFCKSVIRNAMIDYKRKQSRLMEHEVCFSALSEEQLEQLENLEQLDIAEEYREAELFQVLEYEIEVEDELLRQALHILCERNRTVILLSFFLEMTDAEIAEQMKLVRSTIQYHRASSLQKLNRIIKELKDEENE